MFKRFLKWLGFRKRRVPHGELCPWSGPGSRFVCRYAKRIETRGEPNSTGAVDCTATLRQLLDCDVRDEDDRRAIRELLAKTEGAVHS